MCSLECPSPARVAASAADAPDVGTSGAKGRIPRFRWLDESEAIAAAVLKSVIDNPRARTTIGIELSSHRMCGGSVARGRSREIRQGQKEAKVARRRAKRAVVRRAVKRRAVKRAVAKRAAKRAVVRRAVKRRAVKRAVAKRAVKRAVVRRAVKRRAVKRAV